MMLALLQDENSSSWLGDLAQRLFLDPNSYGVPGAQETAMSWMLTGLVISVLLTGTMALVKKLRKDRATVNGKRWSLPKVFGFAAIGLFVVFAILLAVYYFSLNFTSIIGVQGFFKGVVFAWVIYLLTMVGNDLIWPWSRTDYGL
jgi:hypothetical protein